jgi:hypothetical protein
VIRWDVDRADDERVPASLPSQLVNIRVEHWVEKPLAQAIEGMEVQW